MARYVDPAFEMGMALGNAYGNMWAANAKKRQEEKAERLISDMMGGNVTSEDVNAAITSGTGVLDQMNGVTGQDVQAAINGWPVGLTTEDMRNNLRKNKINQEVIDKVMPGYEKQMREAMTSKFLPQIMGSLYGDNPNYGDAMQQVIALSKYNPDTAKLLMSGIPTGRDVFNHNNAITMKGLGDLNRGNSRPQYRVSDNIYKALVDQRRDIVGDLYMDAEEKKARLKEIDGKIAIAEAERGLISGVLGRGNTNGTSTGQSGNAGGAVGLDETQQARVQKAEADINSGMMDAYIASKGDWEQFKVNASSTVAKLKQTGMSDEAIERSMKGYFDNMKSQLSDDKYQTNRTGEVLDGLWEDHMRRMGKR